MWNFKYTPKHPDYHVDWMQINEDFAWIRAMAGVQQEASYHAEGDVETHTRMVAEALSFNEVWRERPSVERHALFLSALLHDVAKPATTVLEGGRWTAPKHTKVGEPMSRRLMWLGEAGNVPPFATRELIAKLVRLHGLPIRFIDKPDPQRAVIEASLVVRMDLLADLAEADVRGRITDSQQDLLDRIEMFRDFCEENKCLTGPYQFESNHHRFIYCVAKKAVEYVPYDDCKFEVVIMSGLPGSGKSTWAKASTDDHWPVISLDGLRDELDVDPADRDEQAGVAREGRERAKALLRKQSPFIWDATSIARDQRAMLVSLCAQYGARTRIVYCESDLNEMLRRNRSRTGKAVVPENRIIKMLERIDIPSPVEAHVVEHVIPNRKIILRKDNVSTRPI